MGAVRRRHVSRRCREAALAAVARVTGDTLAAMQDLYHGGGDACFKRLPDQRVGYAVAVALHLHVVVDMDLDGLEVRHLVAL